MFSFRLRWTILVTTLLALPSTALGGDRSALPNSGDSTAQEDRKLLDLCREYQNSSRSKLKGEETALTSEEKLRGAIARHKGSSSCRLQVMEALAAAQNALGNKSSAFKAYEDMEKLATQDRNLESQVSAGIAQLNLMASEPAEALIQIAARLKDAAEKLATQRKDAATRANCSDVLYRIGTSLSNRAEGASNPTSLLDLAVASLEKSVDLADSSAPSYAAKVYGLAQAQSRMGFQAEAAASYEKLGKIQQSRFSRLSIEYLRICEVMEKDSKDYQAAIERALADSRDRGDNDNYEPVLRHLLGLSYRNTKQYVKSTETLKAHLEKRGDLSAHDMLLIAWNTRDSKDIPGAQKVLEEVVAKYPKTGEGETAQGELRRLIYQPLPPEEVTAQRPRRGVLIGANLAAITILVAIFVRRQVKNKSSQRNCS